MISTYITYASMSALVASTPGPSNYIAAQNGAKLGLLKASFAITGHMSAVLLLAFLAAIGLSSFIVSTPILFNAIKLLGSGYLMFIGYKIFIAAWKESSTESDLCGANEGTALESAQRGSGKRQLWRQHFFVAATNPKAMIFFTALFPQFINPEQNLLEQFIPLATISLCSSFIFPFMYAWLGHNAAKLNIPKSFSRYFNMTVGVIFIGFSLTLALN